jgi:hypothetical protein
MAALWRWYVTKLSTNPLPTKIVSSGIVVGAGDVIAQLLTKEPTFDYKRYPNITHAPTSRSTCGFYFIFCFSAVVSSNSNKHFFCAILIVAS